jgi:mediator complex subunit MED16
MPRFLLRGFTSSLRKLYQIASMNMAQHGPKSATPNAAVFATWNRCNAVFTASPITPLLVQQPQQSSSGLDGYLRGIEGMVRAVYTSAAARNNANGANGSSKSTDMPARVERGMFVSGDIPDVLGDVVKQGMLAKAAQLKEVVMPGNVYRADIGWLGVTDEAPVGDSGGREVVLDVIRKWPMGGTSAQQMRTASHVQHNGGNASAASGKKIKRCPRCRSVSEELNLESSQREALAWLIQAMRQCVCTNSWVMHEEKSSSMTTGGARTG